MSAYPRWVWRLVLAWLVVFAARCTCRDEPSPPQIACMCSIAGDKAWQVAAGCAVSVSGSTVTATSASGLTEEALFFCTAYQPDVHRHAENKCRLDGGRPARCSVTIVLPPPPRDAGVSLGSSSPGIYQRIDYYRPRYQEIELSERKPECMQHARLERNDAGQFLLICPQYPTYVMCGADVVPYIDWRDAGFGFKEPWLICDARDGGR